MALRVTCRQRGASTQYQRQQVIADAAQSCWYGHGFTSHTLAVLYELAVAKRVPSGPKATTTIPLVPSLSVASCLPVATSHSLAVVSAVARRWPSGLKATEETDPPWRLGSMSVRSGWPVAAPQMMAEPPWLPVARSVPSGLKATSSTGRVWPRSVSSRRPVAASHTEAVSFRKLAAARRVPSGLKVMFWSCPLTPVKVCSFAPVLASNISMVPL